MVAADGRMNIVLVLAIALAVSLLGNAVQGKMYVGAREDAAAAKAEKASFIAEQRALGEEAAKKAKDAADRDKKAKEDSDAKRAATVARLTGDIAKLRRERDGARASFLPAAATASPSADTVSFDRAKYLRAYGDLVQGLRGLGDEGTKAVVELDNAKSWAGSVR